MILGFLAEGPLHGYDLRRRMTQLHGYARTISDGTLYPAINRLVASGAVTEVREAGRAASMRRVLHLTPAGRERLQTRLREAHGHDITDGSRFFVILAFLSYLSDDAERRAVLRRRLDFLTGAASFFHDGETPLRSADIVDPYRRGIFVSATATRRAEINWLREVLAAAPTPKSPLQEKT